MARDLELYKNGNYKTLKDGNVEINGREYGIKNEGKTIYPISGPGTIYLNKNQVYAVKTLMNKNLPEKTRTVMLSTISSDDLKTAKDFIAKYYPQ